MSETTLSKRAQKKLDRQDSDNSCVQRPRSATESEIGDIGDDSVLEHVQKRIRNLQKRKLKLDKYAALAATPEGRANLNADQLAALDQKESVEAPLRELNEIVGLYKTQLVRREKQAEEEGAALLSRAKQEAEEARQAGIDLGTEKLQLTVKFLRAASVMRQLTQHTPPEESQGLEKLLGAVYTGDQSSVECIDKLFAGVDEPVGEGLTTYARIKEIALTPVEKLYTLHQKPEKKPEKKPEEQNHSVQKQMPQISFLQEEDDEEDDTKDKTVEDKTEHHEVVAGGLSASMDEGQSAEQLPSEVNENEVNGNGHAEAKPTPREHRKPYRKRKPAQKKKTEGS